LPSCSDREPSSAFRQPKGNANPRLPQAGAQRARRSDDLSEYKSNGQRLNLTTHDCKIPFTARLM
jgi:hypothetical protein